MFQTERLESLLPEYLLREPTAPLPLQGIRVLDFSHFLAGPFATMVLADMGAEVIKVESPITGDNFRYYPPIDARLPKQGAPYLWGNRNKRSVALNLKTEAGRQLAKELVAQADVLVENFSTGVMERFDLGYEACAELNSRLIYCSVSAYGRKGRFAGRSGFDPVAQAESGFMEMNGYPDRPGVRSGAAVMDISTGSMASNAILGALLARYNTGKGQFVEVALFDTAAVMSGFAVMQYLVSGNVPGRHGNTSPDSSPSGLFKASDKEFIINCGTTDLFQRLFRDVIGRPDIADDPGFHERAERLARRAELFAILEEAFEQHPWSYWGPRLLEAGVPSGVVRNVAEAVESEEARERGLFSRIPHPELGWLPNISSPFRFSETPVRDPSPPPAVGEHTISILKEVLGYDDTTISALLDQGVIDAQGLAVADQDAV